MAGLPIRNFENLIKALESLGGISSALESLGGISSALEILIGRSESFKNPCPFFWEGREVSLTSGVVEEIVLLEEANEYLILIKNLSDVEIQLFQDEQPPVLRHSALTISPGQIIELRTQDVTIYAGAFKDAAIAIDIWSSTKPINLGEPIEMPHRFIIKPEFSTEDNFYDWYDYYRGSGLDDKRKSWAGYEGFKGISVISYDPTVSQEEGYELNISETFPDIDREGEYLQVHEVTPAQMLTIGRIYDNAGDLWQAGSLFQGEKTWVSGVREGSVKNKYHSSRTDKVILMPMNNTLGYFFKVKVKYEGWYVAVIKKIDNHSIEIVGF